jgi:hypothetical protein
MVSVIAPTTHKLFMTNDLAKGQAVSTIDTEFDGGNDWWLVTVFTDQLTLLQCSLLAHSGLF